MSVGVQRRERLAGEVYEQDVRTLIGNAARVRLGMEGASAMTIHKRLHALEVERGPVRIEEVRVDEARRRGLHIASVQRLEGHLQLLTSMRGGSSGLTSM